MSGADIPPAFLILLILTAYFFVLRYFYIKRTTPTVATEEQTRKRKEREEKIKDSHDRVNLFFKIMALVMLIQLIGWFFEDTPPQQTWFPPQ